MVLDDDYTLRVAAMNDMESLAELWWESARYHQALEPRFQYASDASQATREFILKQMQSDDACFWVAQKDSKVIGYIETMVIERPPIHVQRRIGYIGSIYVQSEFRMKGLGTKLWQTAHDWLKQKGVTVINLTVASKNPDAFEFWKKLGFSEIMVRLELNSS
ncbi:MAG: GNAT family N-acetyltransferase [Candidatus Thorarchaeota archaeon]|nr:GNAT family N-acetyltransferase [Candidatus Thorarchaeota archaeon]